jgi:hypothetical protein
MTGGDSVDAGAPEERSITAAAMGAATSAIPPSIARSLGVGGVRSLVWRTISACDEDASHHWLVSIGGEPAEIRLPGTQVEEEPHGLLLARLQRLTKSLPATAAELRAAKREVVDPCSGVPVFLMWKRASTPRGAVCRSSTIRVSVIVTRTSSSNCGLVVSGCACAAALTDRAARMAKTTTPLRELRRVSRPDANCSGIATARCPSFDQGRPRHRLANLARSSVADDFEPKQRPTRVVFIGSTFT